MLQPILMTILDLTYDKMCKKLTRHVFLLRVLFPLVYDFFKQSIKDKTFKFSLTVDSLQLHCLRISKQTPSLPVVTGRTQIHEFFNFFNLHFF